MKLLTKLNKMLGWVWKVPRPTQTEDLSMPRKLALNRVKGEIDRRIKLHDNNQRHFQAMLTENYPANIELMLDELRDQFNRLKTRDEIREHLIRALDIVDSI